MSKTITISDDTFEALRGQIKKSEEKEKEPYPIAALNLQGDRRLILNLPDTYLSSAYKGFVFSIDENGGIGKMERKEKCRKGYFYRWCGPEKQLFPIV